MNKESKNGDPRFWEKWTRSGAVENFRTAELRRDFPAIGKTAKTIFGIGYNPGRDISTLSIGEPVVNEEGWSDTQPECVCVVPGHPFEVGQKVKVRDLPKDTQTIEQAYP